MHHRDEVARAVAVERRDLVDVGAADKGALAGAGQDHEPQRRVGFEPLDGLDDLDHQRAVEGVELRPVVDRHARQMAAFRPLLTNNEDRHRALLRLEVDDPLVHSRRGLRREARVDVIEDIAEIREIYGEPMERAVKKQLPRLEKHSRAFIALSPFLVMATSDPIQGRCDASPKGDAPGFVRVIDDETLLIPDRLGNNRIDTIGNLLASPGVGLIFFVPGLRETLRVNGQAPDHHRSGIARTLRRAGQGAAQRHPGDRRGGLFPLRQGADPLRSVEPGKAAAAIRVPLARPHHRRADRRTDQVDRGIRALHRRELPHPPLLSPAFGWRLSRKTARRARAGLISSGRGRSSGAAPERRGRRRRARTRRKPVGCAIRNRQRRAALRGRGNRTCRRIWPVRTAGCRSKRKASCRCVTDCRAATRFRCRPAGPWRLPDMARNFGQ